MPTTPVKIQRDMCPLCQQANNCMLVENPDGIQSCWCYKAAIDKAILAKIPPELQYQVCICQSCADKPDAPLTPPNQ